MAWRQLSQARMTRLLFHSERGSILSGHGQPVVGGPGLDMPWGTSIGSPRPTMRAQLEADADHPPGLIAAVPSRLSHRWWLVIAILVGIAAWLAVLKLNANHVQRDDNRALIGFYCQEGAVSAAQEHGCETHVTAAKVNAYANAGDPTAIAAEHQLSNYIDAAEGQ